jgi:DNA primase
MGPDYTHWHGTYEVAKHFYSHYIPELEELVEKNKDSSDPGRKEAAATLAKLLEETLNGSNHAWYLNKMSPEEKALRDQQRKEFQQRYAK